MIQDLYKQKRSLELKEDNTDESLFWIGMGAIVLWIVIIVLTIGNLIKTEEFLSALLNPEYWALQQILEYVK